MIEELISGIRNAMDRGYSIEKVAQSFINAGYNPMEVKEAVNFLTQGTTSIVEENQEKPKPQLPQKLSLPSQSTQPSPKQNSSQPSQSSQPPAQIQGSLQPKRSLRRKILIFSLLAILLLLIIGLGLLIAFKDSVLKFVQSSF